MKVAEALREIKSVKGKLSRLWSLYGQSVYYPEDEKPEFDARELKAQIDEKTVELRKVKNRVSQANLKAMVKGASLSEALVELGDLRGEVAQLESIFRNKPENNYLSERTIRHFSAYSDLEQVQRIEELGEKIEKLDNEIQKVNWQFELP